MSTEICVVFKQQIPNIIDNIIDNRHIIIDNTYNIIDNQHNIIE